jgi:hypothetical protein
MNETPTITFGYDWQTKTLAEVNRAITAMIKRKMEEVLIYCKAKVIAISRGGHS